MKGRRKIEGIIALVLSLSIIMPNFSGMLQVSATTGDEVITSETPATEEVIPTSEPTTEPTVEPTTESTVEPSEIPETNCTIKGVVKFGEAYMPEGEELLLSLSNSNSEPVYYKITVGKNGEYSIIPDTSSVADGIYTLSVEKAGFNVTNAETQIEIKDKSIVSTSTDKVISIDVVTDLATAELTPDASNDDAWKVNKTKSYVISNYNSSLVYSCEANSNLFDVKCENGYLIITSKIKSEDSNSINVKVSFNGVDKVTAIDVNKIDICETSVSMNLGTNESSIVPEQKITVSVANISGNVKGEVLLSCIGSETAQGSFYVLKDGNKVLCKDGKVQLSEYADSTGSFDCYYVGTGKYANYGLNGELTFKADYSGVTDEFAASSGEASGTYNTAEPIYFKLNENDESIIATTNEVDVVYGTEGYKVPLDETKSAVEGYTCTYSYKLVDEQNKEITDATDLPYTVSEDGQITVNRVTKEGETVRVKVTRKCVKNKGTEGKDIEDASAYLEIKIIPKEITISFEGGSYSIEKTYDNTNKVAFTNNESNSLNVKLDGVIEKDKDAVQVESVQTNTGEIKDAGSSAYENVDFIIDSVKLSGERGFCYAVKLDENLKINGTLKIKQREISVVINDAEKEYSKVELTPVNADSLVAIPDENSFLATENSDGVSKNTVAIPKVTIAWNEGEKDAVGEYNNVLVLANNEVTDTTGKVLSNYIFKVKEDDTNVLKVTSEKINNVWEKHLSTNNTINYFANNTRWISKVNTVKLNIESEAYDVVLLVDETGNKSIIADKYDENVVFNVGELQKPGEYEYKICLATKTETADGVVYNNESETVNVKFYYDNEVPSVDIKDGDTSIISTEFPKLKFTVISNKKKTLTINTVDNPDSSYASGIKEWSYAELKVDRTMSKEALQALVDNGELNWIETYSEATKNIEIGSNDNNEVESNNYLVFVKTYDNVGNSKIYVSNGMVLEDIVPTATISTNEESDNTKGDAGFFDSDVNVTIKAEDTNIDAGINAGIKNVYLHVAENSDDSVVLSKEQIIEAGDKISEVYDINNSLINGDVIALKKGSDNYYIGENGAESYFNVSLNIKETDNWDIKDGKIQVVVQDYAGNYSALIETQIVIDKEPPAVVMQDYTKLEHVKVVDGENYSSEDLDVIFDVEEENYDIEKVYLRVERNSGEAIRGKITEVNELLKEYGISVDYSNEKSIKVSFTKDCNYDVKLECTDKSGNLSSAETCFTLDKVDPVMSVSYGATAIKENESIKYFKIDSNDVDSTENTESSQCVELTFTLTELNFKDNKPAPEIKVVESVYNTSADKYDETDVKEYKTKFGDWEEKDGTYTYSILLPADYRHEVTVNYEDPAARELKSVEGLVNTIVVDKTAPTIEIKNNITKEVWDSFFDSITFDIFSDDKVTVTATATDTVSEINSFGYLVYDPVNDESVSKNEKNEVEVKGLTLAELKEKDNAGEFTELINKEIGFDFTKDYTIQANERSVIYYRLVNESGIQVYYNSAGIVVDNIAPEVVETNQKDIMNKIYNSSVSFSFDVEETGNYSGIEYISCVIVTDGDENILAKKENNYPVLTKKVEAFTVDDIRITNKELTYKEVKAIIIAKDHAGNEYEKEYTIAKDDVKPVISLAYDDSKSEPYNGKYFNADRIATITFTEAHFSKENVSMSVMHTDAETGIATEYVLNEDSTKLVNNIDKNDVLAELSWSFEEYDKSANESLHDRKNMAEIKFVKEGDYEISEISCTDLSGNPSNEVQTEQAAAYNFVIDSKDPVISLAYDDIESEPYNDKYFNADRIATVTFEERNFVRSGVSMTVEHTDAETGITTEYVLNSAQTKLVKEDANGSIDVLADISWGTTNNNNTNYNSNSAKITFIKEGDYKITEISCTDLSGNSSNGVQTEQAAAYNFVIDKTCKAPSIAYSDSAINEKYFRSGRTATVTFTERNFASANANVVVEYKSAYNAEPVTYVLNSNQTKLVNKIDENDVLAELIWTYSEDNTNEKTNTATVTFIKDKEGYYSIKDISYLDLANNPMNEYTTEGVAPKEFVVDNSYPDASISVEANAKPEIDGAYQKYETKYNNEEYPWSINLTPIGQVPEVKYEIFSRETVKVTINGYDSIAPIKSMDYLITTDSVMSWEELENSDQWINISNSYGKNVHSDQFELEADQQAVIYLKVTNMSDIETYVNSEGIIVDNSKPTSNDQQGPSITVTNQSASKNGLFNEDVKLKVNVIDPVIGGTYSGIAEVWYVVNSGDNSNNSNGIGTNIHHAETRTQSWQQVTEDITISAKDYNSNDVSVTVYAMDFAGNVSSTEIDLSIDVTKPTIDITWNNATALNNSYYKDTRVATITIDERNFDKNAVDIVITNTDNNSVVYSEWTTDGNAGKLDSAENKRTVSFVEDGDYTMEVRCVDKAGNVSETVKIVPFTVDKTEPTISVTYNNNSVKNGKYYKDARTATVMITEHNFNASEVEESIKAMLDGANVTAPVMSGFTSNGDVHTATIKYLADGDYTFDIAYSDLAGNAADDFAVDNFTVDTVAPEIEFFDIVDKSANNGKVTPGIKYSDINYSKDDVTIKIVGANNGEVSIEKIHSLIKNGESIKLTDFAHTEEMDDLYTITAIVVDKAGNETEKKIQFSVNRFGSVYVFGNDTCKSWVEAVYHNEEAEIYIKEINVDNIEESIISVSRNGELKELVLGEDYTATKNNTSTGWSEVHYKLNADNFAEEGNYKITFTSKDRAGNSMDNENARKKDAKCIVEFVIDKTAPTIVIGGVVDNGQYRESSRNLIVDAQDAIALREVVITIDGREIIYTVEVDTETGNKKPLKDAMNHQNEIKELIESAGGWQEISIVATDMAGNVFSYGEQNPGDGGTPIRVLVSPNVFIQYYNNTPVFVGSIIGLIVIAATIFFIIYKKKKNKES